MSRPERDDVPERPECYKDPVIYAKESEICRNCPYYFPCGISMGVEYEEGRKEMEEEMAENRLALKDAVEAIRTAFPETTIAAVELSFSRRLRKYA